MTKNLDKDGLRSIVENYDIFYIDLWGVVHNGITLHKNAIEALEEITKANKDYVLLTNAPRPNKVVKTILEKMGMNKEIREKVYSSGEASLSYLKKNYSQINFFIILGPLEILICFQTLKKINLKILKVVNIYYVQDYLKSRQKI
jgi:ribonucleotide monophosphatase NagD (HAD superfamily)